MSALATAPAARLEPRFASFIRDSVNPGAEDRDAVGVECPPELLREAHAIGLFGYALPTELGGTGADALEWGLLLEALGYLCVDASFPTLLSARVWVTETLLATGRADVIERYVQPMARAELFGSFAYSDGADPFAFTSTLRQRGSGFVANGKKQIVTGATSADVFVTFLHDESTGDMVVALVERSDPGVVVEPVHALGMRGLGLGSLHLQDVELPADRIIAGTDGITYAQQMLNARRVILVTSLVGGMQALHEHCVEQLSTTLRYGMPLSEMPNVQAALGRQFMAVETSRTILHRALRVLAGHEEALDPAFDPFVSTAKYEITNRGVELALSALRLLGGRGYLRGRAERFLRDVCSLLAAGGTQDVLEIDLGILAASLPPIGTGAC